jgi:hypothetical protein
MPLSFDDLVENEEGRLCHQGEPFTGLTEDFYEDGQISYRASLLNGVQHGLQQD